MSCKVTRSTNRSGVFFYTKGKGKSKISSVGIGVDGLIYINTNIITESWCGSLSEFVDMVANATEGAENPKIIIDYEQGYGDYEDECESKFNIWAEGSKKPTAEELELHKQLEAEYKEQCKEARKLVKIKAGEKEAKMREKLKNWELEELRRLSKKYQ